MAHKADRRQARRTAVKVSHGTRLACSQTYVRHPRYGATPLQSNDRAARAEAAQRFRRYQRSGASEVHTDHGIYYPDSALKIRLLNRGYWDPETRLCVDRGRPCKTCGKWFLFWAQEQRYWFRTLAFLPYADCVECWACRSARHRRQRLVERYETLLARPDKTPDAWDDLAALGAELFRIGYIKKPETLLKTRMPKRMRRGTVT